MPNVEDDKVREHVAKTFFLDGMIGGDWEKAASVLDDDVVWSVPSDSAIGGMWRGKDAVVKLGRSIADGGVKVGFVRLEYGLERIAVVVHNKGSRDGKTLDEHLTVVFTVSGGKAVFIEAFISDLPMLDAFLPKPDPST